MRCILLSACLLTAICAEARSQSEDRGQCAHRADLAQELTCVVAQRMEAYSHGNKQEYASFLADEYMGTNWIGGVTFKSQAVQSLPDPSAGGWFTFHIDEVQVRAYSGTAVMSFRLARDEKREADTAIVVVTGQASSSPFHYRETDVFTRRGERWELIAVHITEIAAARTAVRVDPRTFEAYVGQYELGDGMIISITTDGGKLYSQRAGRPRHELLPEVLPGSEERFFIPGDPGSYIFRRDDQGRIAYRVYRSVGGETAARRIR